MLAAAGLTVVDVEELPTHGGSLRTWSRPSDAAGEPEQRGRRRAGRRGGRWPGHLAGHAGFAGRSPRCATISSSSSSAALARGARVVGYGRPGKGNTLLNHCGIRSDLLAFTVDRNPFKHGKFLPGTHIPIHPVERLAEDRPDYVLILPWNLREEITAQLAYVREWGGRLVVALPATRGLLIRPGGGRR